MEARIASHAKLPEALISHFLVWKEKPFQSLMKHTTARGVPSLLLHHRTRYALTPTSPLHQVYPHSYFTTAPGVPSLLLHHCTRCALTPTLHHRTRCALTPTLHHCTRCTLTLTSPLHQVCPHSYFTTAPGVPSLLLHHRTRCALTPTENTKCHGALISCPKWKRSLCAANYLSQ